MENAAEAPRSDRLDRLVSKAMGRPEDPTVPKRKTFSTVCLVGGILGLGGAVASLVFSETLGIASIIVVPSTGLIGLFCLAKVVLDKRITWPADRQTSEKALKAYFCALKYHWWAGAASCLSWSAKDGTPIWREEIAALELDAVEIPVCSDEGLLTFWAVLMGGGRKMSFEVLKAEPHGPDRALVAVNLNIALDLNRTSLNSKARQGGPRIRNESQVLVAGRWATYRRDGLWYVLDAGFPEGVKIAKYF